MGCGSGYVFASIALMLGQEVPGMVDVMVVNTHMHCQRLMTSFLSFHSGEVATEIVFESEGKQKSQMKLFQDTADKERRIEQDFLSEIISSILMRGNQEQANLKVSASSEII
ncbi:hypothetical protein OIU79_010037 [Salix purpurea]|uniref:Uncharacterized protein n=1 Tax=Salix purpurea TaxID=77065 RepID=A0A9Q0QES8_SALPP|nr:hypothetical protein OIU79_010037 [Salix purpurea]